MTVSASVLLPEPFGPMIACTSPLRTTRSIPFRISLPSTVTCRSLMTRSGNGRFLLRKIGEGHAVERLRDGRLELHPYRARPAVLLADAVEDRVALGGADLRLDRAFQRANDVARGDRGGTARERVAAPRATLAVHETGLAKHGDELLEICLGQVLARGDRVKRDGALLPVAREVDHEAHAVFAPRGHVKGGLWISEQCTRNARRWRRGPPGVFRPSIAARHAALVRPCRRRLPKPGQDRGGEAGPGASGAWLRARGRRCGKRCPGPAGRRPRDPSGRPQPRPGSARGDRGGHRVRARRRGG